MIRQWILVFLIGVIAQGEGEPKDFRLSENVVPNHYKIKILTDLSDNFFYNGEVSVDFFVKTATDRIILHSKNLKIFENETKLEEFGKSGPHTNEKNLRRPKEVSWGVTNSGEFASRPKAEPQDAEFKDEEENERVLAVEKRKTDVDLLRYALYGHHSKKSSESSSDSSDTSESSDESSEEKIDGSSNSTSPTAGMTQETGMTGEMKPHESGMEGGAKPPKESGMGGGAKPTKEPGMGGGAMTSEESGMGGGAKPPKEPGMGGGAMTSEESEMGGGAMTSEESGMGGGAKPPKESGMGGGAKPPKESEMGGGAMTSEESEMGGGAMTSEESGMGGGAKPPKESGMGGGAKPPKESEMGGGAKPPKESEMGGGAKPPKESEMGGGAKPPKESGMGGGAMTPEEPGMESGGMPPKESGMESGIMPSKEPGIEGGSESPLESALEGGPIKKKHSTQENAKGREEHAPVRTITERTKYTTEEYTMTNDKIQPSMKNQNDNTEYTTLSAQHSTHKYTKPPQESLHTTGRTAPSAPEHSTAGYTKQQSTTHHPTMDDKIHFATHAQMMLAQKDSTTQPPAEVVTQPTTQGSVMPPLAGLPHMEDIPVMVPEESYSVLKHEFDTGNEFLVLHLDKPLSPGKKYTLYLTYQGLLTDTLTGFHRVPYIKRGSTKSTWLASTVFEPNEARTAFPCFDEPALKATFDVTLGHDKKYTALSNMPLKKKAPIEGKPEWQWSEFERTPPMSTYTVAFLISDLEYLTPRLNYSDSSQNVTYRFWSRPDVLYKTRYAMRIAPEMKNHLESVLGVRDVLPKHDFVALPNFISTALENWGLYSFAEKNLLFTSGFSSIFSKFEITHIVGHEIAHMWFGNMVTPKWWDQIWLSEGFANFFEIIAADHVQPNWDLKTVSVIFSYLKVFTSDALHTSHPLVPKLDHPNDLNEIFDSITYQKGFYLVRMLNYTLGQEAFMNGVRRYLRDHLLSTVDENDLWDALTDSAHQENTLPADYHLKDIMHAWTRRTGYPIIDVIRDYDNHTANITQRRFIRSKNDYEFRENALDTETGDTKWWIPLTYTTGSELNFRDFKPRVWLKPQDDYYELTDMPSKSDFVLMNLDAAGLYRVNYDQRNWELIISYLINENASDISVINRVQILDDLLDLARAGEISYERALDATSYLAKEKHFLPWKAALSNFDFILRMLRSTDSNKSFKKFVRNMVAPRFEELGFESARNEALSDGLNRKQIAKWACKTGVRSCTRKSISLFKKWTLEKKPDEHNPIPSNLRSIVYCTAIENGGSKDWQFLWQRYLSNMVTDRTAILYGLGCSRSTRTLRKFLDWSIKETSGIKKQDTPTVFKSVVKNDLGFNLAKTFLRERMGDIKSYVGNNPFYLPQMIESVAAKMNQPADLEELEELEQAHFSHLRTVPRSFRQAAERVRFNINWVEKNFKPIQDWLKKQRV